MDTLSITKTSIDRPGTGMAAAIGAYFMLSVMNLFAKLLSEAHNVVEIAFYRNVIALLPFFAWIFLFRRRDILIVQSKPKILVIRSLAGTASLILTFGAYSLLPMADATAYIFTSSLFVPMLGFFFLGEKVGPYRWSAVLAGFLGVLVMAHPTGAWNGLGIALALIAALMQAMLGTLLRLLGRTEKPETVTFYFLLIGAVMTALPMPFIATMPAPREMVLFICAGLSGAAAQFLLSVAFKYAPAAVVTVFNYLGLIWATAFGWFIWGDWPEPPIWLGGGLVIAASLFILWRENYLAHRARLTPRDPPLGK